MCNRILAALTGIFLLYGATQVNARNISTNNPTIEAKLETSETVLATEYIEKESGSRIFLTGPKTPVLDQRVDYEILLEAENAKLKDGIISILIPNATPDKKNGVFVHYNDIQFLYSNDDEWKPIKKGKGGKIAFGVLKMGVGLAPGPSPFSIYNFGKLLFSKENPETVNEEIENYFDSIEYQWGNKYQKVKLVIPLTILNASEIPISLIYKEDVETKVRVGNSEQTVKTETPRKFSGNLLELITKND